MVREETMADPRVGAKGWPLVRGITTLVEALKLGSRCLRFSAELYEQDMEAEEKAKKAGPSTLALLSLPIIALVNQEPDSPPPLGKEGGAGKSLFTLLTIVFALGLFVALPQAFAAGTSRVFDLNLDVRDPRFQVLTGAAKLVIVIGYMAAIRRMAEIRRVFEYHGAEHKTISPTRRASPWWSRTPARRPRSTRAAAPPSS
jgi:uncharacterized protein YqhQ